MNIITFTSASGQPGVIWPAPNAQLSGESNLAFASRVMALSLPTGATNAQIIDSSAYVPPPPSPAAVLGQKLAAGITLTSTGTPAINGTYAYDQQTQTDLSGIAATIGLLGTFPDGSTSGYQYPQLGGLAVTTFASIAAFKLFYAAYAKLLQQLQAQGDTLAKGGTPTWPSQSVTTA